MATDVYLAGVISLVVGAVSYSAELILFLNKS